MDIAVHVQPGSTMHQGIATVEIMMLRRPGVRGHLRLPGAVSWDYSRSATVCCDVPRLSENHYNDVVYSVEVEVMKSDLEAIRAR